MAKARAKPKAKVGKRGASNPFALLKGIDATQTVAVKVPLFSPDGRVVHVTRNLLLPKGYLSVTQVLMHQRCPRQYQQRYVHGVKEPPGVALVEGSSHHVAFKTDNERKRKGRPDLSAKQLGEVFADTFTVKCEDIPKDQWEQVDQTVDTVIERGRKILAVYADHAMRKRIEPVAEEEPFLIRWSGLPVFGIVDLREAVMVTDYKVTARAPSQGQVDGDLQLTTYHLATNAPGQSVLALTKTKMPALVRKYTRRPKRETVHAKRTFILTAASISTGLFPPCDPKEWCCCERFCGYWRRCRGKQ